MSASNLDSSACRDLIATTLRGAQLQYAWADGAEPIAVLGLQLPNRPRLDLSVRHSGTVLQLIAHHVLPGPREPQRIADYDVLNQSWGVGRVYFSEAAGAWDASVGLFAPEGAPPTAAFRSALATLADAPELYAKGQPPQVLVEPQPTIEAVMPAVERALASASLHPTSEHDGEVMSVLLQMDRIRAKVSWFLAGSVLIARAQPVGASRVTATPQTLVALDKLNSRLDIGGVGLWYEHAIAYGWIGHFASWFTITPQAVRWTSERAASWAEAAQALPSGAPA